MGEVEVSRVEVRLFTPPVAEHGHLAVVDHDFRGNPAEEHEGVVVRAQEVLLTLAEGELEVHPPAEAQHHHEEGELASSVADLDHTG